MALGLAVFWQWSTVFSWIGIGVVGTIFLLHLLSRASKSTVTVIKMTDYNKDMVAPLLSQDTYTVLIKILSLSYVHVSLLALPIFLSTVSDHALSHCLQDGERSSL